MGKLRPGVSKCTILTSTSATPHRSGKTTLACPVPAIPRTCAHLFHLSLSFVGSFKGFSCNLHRSTTQASRKCLSEDNCANPQGCRHKGVLEEWGAGDTTSVSTRIEHIIQESHPSPGRHHKSALIMKKDIWLRKVSGCRGAFLVKLAHKH